MVQLEPFDKVGIGELVTFIKAGGHCGQNFTGSPLEIVDVAYFGVPLVEVIVKQFCKLGPPENMVAIEMLPVLK